MSDKPVFFDASGRRAVGASVVGWTAAVVSLVLGAVFAASLVARSSGNAVAIAWPTDRYHQSRIWKRRRSIRACLRSAARLAARSANPAQGTCAAATRARTSARPADARPVVDVASASRTGRCRSRFIRTGKRRLCCRSKRAAEARLADADLAGTCRARTSSSRRASRYRMCWRNIATPSPILPFCRCCRTRRSANGTGPAWRSCWPIQARSERSAAVKLVAFVAANKLQGVTVDFEEVPDGARKPIWRAFLKATVGGVRAAWLDHRAGRAVRRRQLALRGLCANRRLHDADGL